MMGSLVTKVYKSSSLLCKDGNVENVSHFLFACPKLEDEWATFWKFLKEKVSNSDNFEKNILLHFIENLDEPTTARLLLLLYRSITVLRILLTSLLLYPLGRYTGSDKTCMIREVLF